MTLQDLGYYLNDIHDAIDRLESQQGNVQDIDWDEMDRLAVEMGRVREAIAIMGQSTYGQIKASGWIQ